MSKLLCFFAITAIVLAVKADEESRIIGGKIAVNGQFPHHVQIRDSSHWSKRPHCGGSIIGDRFVLTTARCVAGYKTETQLKLLKVIVGEVDLMADAIKHEVERVVIHPKYEWFDYDVGVVRVVQPFKFTANVRAIKLPTEDTPILNDGSAIKTTFVGWGQNKPGTTGDPGHFTQKLQWFHTTAISHPECMALLGGVGSLLRDYHICARDEPRSTICAFDLGGGLITTGAQPVIIGVLALDRYGCYETYKEPNVYTRVFPFLPFIRLAMQ